jgi:AP2-like factor (euAP2 lineage)
MKEIKLSKKGKNRGKYVALVDDEDFERVSQFNWHVQNVYASRRIKINGVQKGQTMHQFLMNRLWVDHKDGNGLNNQKDNLRFCTNQQNQQNQKRQKNTVSIYKGVVWNKRKKKWEAQIYISGKRKYLGLYKDEREAASKYDKAAKEHFGEFCNLNIK